MAKEILGEDTCNCKETMAGVGWGKWLEHYG